MSSFTASRYCSADIRFPSSCLVSIFLFAVTLFIVSQTSTRDFPASAYMFIIFLNGLVTGAAMNYTFVHMLHLVPKDLHVIVTPVVGMFRGFAGSFGSSIGGGIFYRALKQSLDEGFQRHDINGKAELTRRLLGSPALVKELAEPDKTIAITGYVAALRTLFMAGVGAAIITIVVQAGTGWRGAADVNLDEEHATTDSETS